MRRNTIEVELQKLLDVCDMKRYDKKKLIDAMKKEAYGWLDELMVAMIFVSLIGVCFAFSYSVAMLSMWLFD